MQETSTMTLFIADRKKNEMIGWHIAGEKHGSLIPLAECNDFHQVNSEEMHYLSNLFVSAPQLLEALKKIRSMDLMNETYMGKYADEFEKLIKQAEGK